MEWPPGLMLVVEEEEDADGIDEAVGDAGAMGRSSSCEGGCASFRRDTADRSGRPCECPRSNLVNTGASRPGARPRRPATRDLALFCRCMLKRTFAVRRTESVECEFLFKLAFSVLD